MMQIMTDEQILLSNIRIGELAASDKLRDQLTAILMNSYLGGFGLHEETAFKKVDALLEFLRGKGDQLNSEGK